MHAPEMKIHLQWDSGTWPSYMYEEFLSQNGLSAIFDIFKLGHYCINNTN